jgi:prepilin-type N-terminal cleavage/methylation domain-containing protein
MFKGRQGFTLIELLIVVVIIGILAAIAIPKFSKTRERAYFSAMKSDLKNLAAEQEIYYSDPAHQYQYAPDLTALDFSPSSGVTISMSVRTAGWEATATHQALDASRYCVYYWGDATPAAPATVTGVVSCTGE